MTYFDTSYLVRLYYRDPGWEAVRKLAENEHIACAWHGQAEMLGAFHRKMREGAIQTSEYAALTRQFRADNDHGAFQWLPQGRETLIRVSDVYRDLPQSEFLRAADALHLAAAAEHGMTTIYSHDVHLLAAARHFGLRGQDVIAAPSASH